MNTLIIKLRPSRGGFLASFGRRQRWGVTADEALGALCRFYIETGSVTLFWGVTRKVGIKVEAVDGYDSDG
jgi:hypothetical protein